MKAYVTGPAALAADQHIAGDRSMQMIEALTFTVIIVMLLLVYRSIVTVLLTLAMVVLALSAARGVVAFLGYYEIIGLSTFATNLLVTLAIAASTDYAIFLIGRYQEARGVGEDREPAYYTMFHGTAHVVLGSGLTIAGATFCLHFTKLPYFLSLGIPLAIGMVIVRRLRALTLGPGRHHRGQPSSARRWSPSAPCAPAAGARSAPPWCAGPGRSWWPPSRCRWSVCWPCPATRPTTTTATTCPPTCRPTRATPRRTGISRRPG